VLPAQKLLQQHMSGCNPAAVPAAGGFLSRHPTQGNEQGLNRRVWIPLLRALVPDADLRRRPRANHLALHSFMQFPRRRLHPMRSARAGRQLPGWCHLQQEGHQMQDTSVGVCEEDCVRLGEDMRHPGRRL
jgi:hypothetical protein